MIVLKPAVISVPAPIDVQVISVCSRGVARLREWGARRPDRGYNRRIFNGKLLAEGRDEEGFAFWVSAERPDPDLPDAWG